MNWKGLVVILNRNSSLQEKELAVKERYNAIINKSHEKYDEMLDKSSEFITNWEDRSRDFIMGFISMFGRESFVS